MALKTLSPRLGYLNTVRLPDLAEKPGIQQRIRGRKGVEQRKQIRKAHDYLCVRCSAVGRVASATQVDHRIPLEDGGSNDPSNLDPICVDCHKAKTKAEAEATARARRQPLSHEASNRRLPSDLPRAGIPLTIVCGPPGAGKSTYVREHATTDDVVIDLDAIGLNVEQALDERNRQLRALGGLTQGHAWFIVACPRSSERRHWAAMLGGSMVLLDVPLETCIQRIRSDPKRAGHEERMIKAAESWWHQNNQS